MNQMPPRQREDEVSHQITDLTVDADYKMEVFKHFDDLSALDNYVTVNWQDNFVISIYKI